MAKKVNIILNLTYSNFLETNCAKQITHVCALGLYICSNIIKHILGILDIHTVGESCCR